MLQSRSVRRRSAGPSGGTSLPPAGCPGREEHRRRDRRRYQHAARTDTHGFIPAVKWATILGGHGGFFMAGNRINRREFATGLAAGALAGGLAEAQNRAPAKGGAPAQAKAPSTRSILNYNDNMEYRRLGRTGLMVSAISLGGHWKRIEIELGKDKTPARVFRQRLLLSQDTRVPAVAGPGAFALDRRGH